MSIRCAGPEDLPAIVAIYNQAIAAGRLTGDTVPVDLEERTRWLAGHPPARYPVLVEEQQAGVVGYLGLSAYRPGRLALRHTAELSFYVDSRFHRQGVASRLLRRAIELCPDLQIRNLFAILMEGNSASIAHLQNFGFERWAYLPRVADYDGVEIGQFYYGRRI